MTEETPFEKYIQQLGFTPGSPEWRSMTLAERVLASFAWLEEIVAGTARVEQIAARQKCSIRLVNMTI